MTDPGTDQQAARRRDLQRLRELTHPYVTGGSERLRDVIPRMPAAEAAEALDLLERTATWDEPPEATAARQEALLRYAGYETFLREVLARPHYKVRNGKIVTDPETGEPVTDEAPAREARALLARLERDQARLAGLPHPDDGETAAH